MHGRWQFAMVIDFASCSYFLPTPLQRWRNSLAFSRCRKSDNDDHDAHGHLSSSTLISLTTQTSRLSLTLSPLLRLVLTWSSPLNWFPSLENQQGKLLATRNASFLNSASTSSQTLPGNGQWELYTSSRTRIIIDTTIKNVFSDANTPVQ